MQGGLRNDTSLKRNQYQLRKKPGYRPIAIYRKNKNIEPLSPPCSTEIIGP